MHHHSTPRSTTRDEASSLESPVIAGTHPDVVIRRLAAEQHGVVARRQLLGAGVSRRQVGRRVADSRLERIRRGVYRAGPGGSAYEREMAAVLATAVRAWISHATAGRIWRLLRGTPGERIDVTAIRSYRQPGAGVRVHRVSSLGADEVTRHDGLPITTPERTLLDLAPVLDAHTLERALARGVRERIVSVSRLKSLITRRSRRAGTRRLRELLAMDAGPAFTRSEAEARFLLLVRRAGLVAPLCNVLVRGFEVDFFWPAERLVAEIDGYAFHASRSAFERDRDRDAALLAAGVRVVRVTWRRLVREPEAVVARIAQALARSVVA
jgi:hypothetical protein